MDYNTSLQVNAVWACVSLISDTISSLPVDTYIRRDGIAFPYRPKPTWVTKPDVMLPSIAFWQQTMTSLLIDGNAFIRILRDSKGEIINMMVLNPLAVKVSRNALGQKLFVYTGEQGKTLSVDDVLHIAGSILMPGDLRGRSPIDTLKENIGLAISLESFAARFFGQGTLTQGIIEYPGALTAEQAENLAKS
ncbi:MAG: phage portal protein, partial [Actinobacteria bacterium]|nr:phage portal protein [Actinomycetota bacterium]